LKKKHTLSKSQSVLDAFKGEDVVQFGSSLSENKIRIIRLLDEGYYAAAIARRLDLSRSYVSRFVHDLLSRGFISLEYINPLTRRARSYRVSPELKEFIVKTSPKTRKTNFTLFTPHKIRYKYPITEQSKRSISVSTNRFAASKVKLVKQWCMRGGVRYVFDMKHDHAGHVGIIVHPRSIEVYQRDRHQLPAASLEDATNQMAMALNDVAQRFVQEQAWESNIIELGKPELVGSPHYALRSRLARDLTNSGQTQLPLAKGFEVDKSLEDKYQDEEFAELETQNVDTAAIIDRGLQVAANIENIVPALIKKEIRSVSEEILGIHGRAEKIDELCNNVQALCQSGTPLQQQFNMLQTTVARQSESINLMQQSMLKIIENMGKIIDRIGI
jgi:DNA-binding MarR family transcriptional regulator